MADTHLFPGTDENWEYHNPTGEEFPIMASDARPSYPGRVMPGTEKKQYVQKCEFQRLRECGFNIVRVGTEYWVLGTSADNAGNTDVSICATTKDIHKLDEYKDIPVKDIPDDDVTNYYLGFINSFKDTDGISMFDFGDELPLDLMKKIAAPYNQVMKEGIKQLPIFNRGVYGGTKEELKELQNWFHPAVWCYDQYPIKQECDVTVLNMGEGDPTKYKAVAVPGAKPAELYIGHGGDIYRWLELFRNTARQTGRPFWFYVQSMSFAQIKDLTPNVTVKADVRMVTEEFMRFAVFNALAYGAKGLRYWTYTLRARNKSTNEYYFEAPIDLSNEPTRVWDWVQNVNSEVHALESIFLHSDVEAVYHTGDSIPAYTTRLPEGYGPMLGLVSEKEGVTVSFFTANGKKYIMLVNHDINNSQIVRILWKKGVVPFITTDEFKVTSHFSPKETRFETADGIPQARRVDVIDLNECGYYLARWEEYDFRTNMMYENPTGAEFPIMASQPCPEWMKPVTKAMLEDLKDCGFNMVDIHHNIWKPGQTAELLKDPKLSGLYLSVSTFDWRNTAYCLGQVERYTGLDAVKAFDLYSDIAADPLANHIGQFAQTYNAVRALDTGRLLLWNILGYTVYKDPDKFSEIQDLVRPSMWCNYNYEFFTQDCDAEGHPLDDRPIVTAKSAYAQLEAFARVSRESGRPFWHYVSCMPHWMTGKSYMHPVTEASMRLCAFAGLAYGAKGIRWWGYAMRKSTSGAVYFDAPIGADGNKTEIWGWVKKINYEIGHLGHIFLNSYGHAVHHTGSAIPDGTVQAPTAMGPFKSIATDGEGVLVSTFRSGVMDDRYIMFVNRSPSEEQTVLVSYTQLMSRQDARPQAGTTPDPVGPPGPIEIIKFKNFRLDAGGYALFSYDRNGFTQVW